jgi:hypothetical integral membrane protein (TIGR02206 family)
MEIFFTKDLESGHTALKLFSVLWTQSILVSIFFIFMIILAGFYLPKKSYKITLAKFIGFLLLFRFIFMHGYTVGIGVWNIQENLPLHLCGISSLVSGILMIKYNQRMFEFLILLGFPGAIHSLLSPEFTYGHEGYFFYDFYLSHSGILLVPIYLTIVMNKKIKINSWKSTFYIGLAYTMIVGFLNKAINTIFEGSANYMYLCKAPLAENPLILTKKWPMYLPMLILFGFFHIIFMYYFLKITKGVEIYE